MDYSSILWIDMQPLQQNSVVSNTEVSALRQAVLASGYARSVYTAYAICSIIFYGISIFTALGMLMYFLNGGAILALSTALFLCYVFLNAVIGYGFMFCRRWLLPAFSITLVLTAYPALTALTGGILSRVVAAPSGLYLILGILAFLFSTKRFLSGSYAAISILIPFVGVLLLSLLLTNPGVLH